MAGFLEQEKQVASVSVGLVKRSLRDSIKSNSKSRTGLAERTAGARSVFKNDRLQRIAIKAQHYVFKQNYGFEGTKKNSVKMRLNATEVIGKALENNGILDDLSDSISAIRSEQVLAIINFKK